LAAAAFFAVAIYFPLRFWGGREPFEQRLTVACEKLLQFENSKSDQRGSEILLTPETLAIRHVDAFMQWVPRMAGMVFLLLSISSSQCGVMYLLLKRKTDDPPPA